MNKEIRSWYMSKYPSDDMGSEIVAGVTFQDLFDALDHYRDVYETLGDVDSLIRERAFTELADIMGVEYGYVYDQWMLGARIAMQKHYAAARGQSV